RTRGEPYCRSELARCLSTKQCGQGRPPGVDKEIAPSELKDRLSWRDQPDPNDSPRYLHFNLPPKQPPPSPSAPNPPPSVHRRRKLSRCACNDGRRAARLRHNGRQSLQAK